MIYERLGKWKGLSPPSVLPMVGGVNRRAMQPAPILLCAKILAGVLHVNFGSSGSPAEQSVESNNNDRCNRNQHPPVHADPSTEALLRLATGALASSNFGGKTIGKSSNIGESKIFSDPWIRTPLGFDEPHNSIPKKEPELIRFESAPVSLLVSS
jgi:hypothetical protein